MRVLDLGTRIAPFGDAVGELPLLGRNFAAAREDEVRRHCAPIDPARFTFADHAFATAPILAAFARQATQTSGRASQLAIPEGCPSAALAPVSSIVCRDGVLLLDVFLDAPAAASIEELRAGAKPVLVDVPSVTRRRELPRVGPPPHHLDLPADGVVAAHIEHWVHALWLAPLLVPLEASRRIAERGPWRRVRSRRGLAPSAVSATARVHPTAFLEGSVIGDGAVIGAQCSIRHSYIGARSHLSDFTKVSSSVFEEETHTLVDATFSHVVSFGKGTLASLLLRDVLLGRQVFLTSGVIFWNEAMARTVRVERAGHLFDTGRKNLGGCAGHGCVLGARTIVAPGRALPNRTTVVMRREEGVLKVDGVAPDEPACWYDAALVPVSKRFPDAVPDEIAGPEPRRLLTARAGGPTP